MTRVRVRGIYATALTKILVDKGFEITHASKVIQDRFGIDNKEPPEVTVKDTDSRHGVVIVGEYEHGKRVYNALKEFAVAAWVSKLPLHAVIKGKVIEAENGKSIVDLGEYRGVLEGEREVGEELLVDIARPFMPCDELAKLSMNQTIFGKYVALIKNASRKVIFSKHITNKKLRSELTALSSMLDVGDWCIKWRSSATAGKLEEILKDVKETYKKAEEVMRKGEKVEVGKIVYQGEFFAILCFDRKECLDDVRNNVIPTIRNHHSLKSVGEGEVVDLCEFLLYKGFDRNKLSEEALNYVISRMNGLVRIEHVSVLSGKAIELSPGKAIGKCTIKRVFKKPGVFDGLNVKKEPGDFDMMEFSPGIPIILHRYYSREGDFKGIYVNLNTPPDIARNMIRYVDMEIDVVASDEVKIIDAEKLENAAKLGIISEDVKREYFELAENVKKFLESESAKDITLSDITESLKLAAGLC